MSIKNIFSLLGGLSLFLYGMKMMGTNLEAAAGSRLKNACKRLTANRFLGVLTGAAITAVIQSSSAVTVMVIGFINGGLMTLDRAVWVIMGANIGTTVTSQLIALDIDMFAPLFAFVGLLLLMFARKKGIQYLGGILAGLGVLFIGLTMMQEAMAPLQDSALFLSLMTNFSNPLLGILAGFMFTAVIQSSSAAVGILQALGAKQLIGLDSAAYVLFGQNIGTCATAVIGALGGTLPAKRAAVIHLLFNITGAAVFCVICMKLPLLAWIRKISAGGLPTQIANLHTIFNVGTTLLLLPLGGWLVKAAIWILPDKKTK